MTAYMVVGTVRTPDGDPSGEIDGLVLRENGLLVVINKSESERRAKEGRLSTCIPGDPRSTQIEAVGEPDGRWRLRTKLDDRSSNLLLLLPIWDRDRIHWVNPLRPRGPALGGPGGGPHALG